MDGPAYVKLEQSRVEWGAGMKKAGKSPSPPLSFRGRLSAPLALFTEEASDGRFIGRCRERREARTSPAGGRKDRVGREEPEKASRVRAGGQAKDRHTDGRGWKRKKAIFFFFP